MSLQQERKEHSQEKQLCGQFWRNTAEVGDKNLKDLGVNEKGQTKEGQTEGMIMRSIPSAMPCLARREGLWRRDTVVFATYLPHLLIRFAPTLKSNHNYNLSVMSDLTSEER